MRFVPSFLIGIFCLIAQLSLAQVPTRVVDANGNLLNPKKIQRFQGYRTPCAQNSAGTLNLAQTGLAAGALSNDQMFLCRGDGYRVTHNGNGIFNGDPVSGTAPGIAYIIYECLPTVDGPTRSAVAADPCMEINGSSGTPPYVVDPSFIGQNGSGTILNNGSMQNFFTVSSNGGGTGPISLFFAPATLDNFAGLTWENSGPCVSVNVAQAFRLVFLNEIKIVNPTISGCQGTFTIQGGHPEFDRTDVYNSISIEKQGDPSKTGTVISGGMAPHNGTVQFIVPEAGIYNITVRDDKACPGTTTMNFSGCDNSFVVSFATVNRTCAGGSPNVNGLNLTIVGGTAPYNVSYTGPSTSSAVLNPPVNNFAVSNSLSPGSYTLTVRDAANRVFTSPFTIVNFRNFSIQLTEKSISCSGENDGELVARVIDTNPNPDTTVILGGQYGLRWSTGSINDTISNLSFGTFSVSLTFNGVVQNCVTASRNVSEPNALQLSGPPTITPPSCEGATDGEIILPVTGGSPAAAGYVVTWSNGNSGPGLTTLSGVGADKYVATVTDANNCEFISDTIELLDPPALLIAFQDSLSVSCASACDGSVTGLGSGGSSVLYNFVWSSGEARNNVATHTPTRLCAGINYVTITDSKGCIKIDSVSIPSPPPVTFDSIRVTNVSCHVGNGTSNDGVIFVRATGGSGAYTFTWNTSPARTGNTINNLSAGNYTVTATDGNGCASAPLVVAVGQPDSLNVSVSKITPVTCNGDDDGIVELGVRGGNSGKFIYQWSPNTSDTTSIATKLSAGTYRVTATDSKGCRDTATAVVIQPLAVQAVLDPITPIRCNGETTLVSVDTVTGGTGPYVFSVDGFNFQSINNPLAVPAGTYTVHVRDLKDCEYTESITLTEPLPVVVNLELTKFNNLGVGENVTIEAGTPPTAEIDLGDSIRIFVNDSGIQFGIDSILWETNPILSLCPTNDCRTVGFSSTEDVLVKTVVIDNSGCVGEVMVLIEIDKNRKIYIPNAFNPDSEQQENSTFRVFGGQGVAQVNFMKVFDRWGALVFEAGAHIPSASSDIGWNGNFKGKRASADVYVYVVEVQFIDGLKLLYRGDVTLLY